MEQQMRDILAAVALDLLRKWRVCLQGRRSVRKMLGPMLQSGTK